jgi:CheY-like chemotaxis protein
MRKQNEAKALDRYGNAGLGSSAPLVVLHIDDDSNDTVLLQAAARKAGSNFTLFNVSDGEHAMAYLSGTEPYADRSLYPLPALILLDLKMPRLTGFEILKWIRDQPHLSKIPVLVLSGSQMQDDMKQAYAGGANSYFIKPPGFDSLVGLIQQIDTAWLTASSRDTNGPK